LARDFSQCHISQNPLERGVFKLEVGETLTPSRQIASQPAARDIPKVLVAQACSDDLSRSGFISAAVERPGPHRVPVAGRIEALIQVEGLSNSG
jgi:hypothetical protein